METDPERCRHGIDDTSCYLCHVDRAGAGDTAAWGTGWEPPEPDTWEARIDPMSREQSAQLAFLCSEFGFGLDPTLTEGEADLLIESFLDEPASELQLRTLEVLSRHAGEPAPADMSYGQARGRIRRLTALRALHAM
jgi:hypothetical protein